MKKLKLILIAFAPLICSAQTPTGTTTSWTQYRNLIGSDSGIVNTMTDTFSKTEPIGTERLIKADSNKYVWLGNHWKKLSGTGSGGGGTTYTFTIPLSETAGVVSINLSSYATNTALTNGLATKQNTLGYTAESVANKITSISGTSITSYPSEGAVKNYVDVSISGLSSTYQPLDADLTSIAGLSPTNDDIIQRKAGAWANRTPAQFKTDLVLTKSDVGLSNVDNTSDASKPVSTATQTALDLKQNTIVATTTADYYRGDKTFQTLNKAAVGLGSVDNTSDASKPVSTAAQTALDLKINTSAIGTTVQGYNANTTIQGNSTTGGGTTLVKNINPTIAGITVTGLSSGTTGDSLVVADASTGVFKRISSSRIASGSSSSVNYVWSAKLTDHFDASQITGVTSGASLNTWTNTGNGTLSNLTYDGTAPVYYSNYRGMPAVKFTRTSATSMLFTNQAFKQVVVVCNSTDGATFVSNDGLMSNATSGTDFIWYGDAGTSNMAQFGADELMTQGFLTSNNSFSPLTQTKITYFYRSTGVSARSIRVGGFWTEAGRYWDGYISEIMFFSDKLSKAEYTALHQHLTAKYAIKKAAILFTDGNSLISGGYDSVLSSEGIGARMIEKVDSIIGAHALTANVAVGGTVTDQNDFYAAQVTGIDYKQDYRTLYDPTAESILLYSSTNENAASGSGAACFADIMSYCNNRIAVNPDIKIYIPTAMSCTPSYIDEAERQILNALLRAFRPTKNIIIIDDTDVNFDGPTAYTNGLYYKADGIHLNKHGARIQAEKYIRAMYP